MQYVEKKNGEYTPNHMPANKRMRYIAFLIFLAIYGAYGVLVNDLYIPRKRSKGFHLHDVPALIMYATFICACLAMLSVVADHYDKRNNETNYKMFANVFKCLGWDFFGLSAITAVIR